ncbi:MAG: prolyl oligopeptidase family serine peptidase [Steroidobacteraceae bacterium]
MPHITAPAPFLRSALLACGALSLFMSVHAAETPTADDPYLWLEQVDSPQALDWVKKENARTVAVLEQDARFATYASQARAIAENKDRIAHPSFLNGQVFNFWQDAQHVRGLWRRTSLADYGQTTPQWQPVLDLDRLARDEKANWVWEGANCLDPAERRCLLSLSDGGEDAQTVREFDLSSQRFVAHGFELPRGKQTVDWETENTLLVAREWQAGEMTRSGYPFVVKRWRRGTPLTAARELFRGQPEDVLVAPTTLIDGDGHRLSLIQRALTFFESELYLVQGDAVRPLPLPRKFDVLGMVSNALLVRLNEDWPQTGAATLPAGALVALDATALQTDPAHPMPVLVWQPGPRESLEELRTTRSALIAHTIDNVRGRVQVFHRGADNRWTSRSVPLPDNASTDLTASDQHGTQYMVSVNSFLMPETLYLANDDQDTPPRALKSLPPQFDASNAVVEQFEATSPDGTRVPYFVVHPKNLRLDGSHPTILNAYGGFQVTEAPFYSGSYGKLWLEHGGIFVLANIRGGGEFGPAWHEAGLKTHRQVIYDDFSAVARDLIGRGFTTPRRLGIMGGSNGGLLMGVEMTQHPDLWHAVDIAVPLLDMLRFESIAAGASWVGEYGSVSVPEERTFLASISPYQALRRDQNYPMPLIWTTTKDDRVGPQHARKFAARMAEYGHPYYYYEVIEGGHGAGANLVEAAHTRALEMIYFTRQLMD